MSLKCILQGQNDKSLKLDDNVLKQDNEDVTSQVKSALNAADATIVNTHINDKSNPHEVTVEQIGAVSKTHFLDSDVDLNTVVESGFYRVQDNNGNIPPSVWGQLIVCSGGGDTIFQLYCAGLENRVWFRGGSGLDRNTNTVNKWYDWVELANLSALANYLPLAGGTMSGSLGIAGGYGAFLADANSAFMQYQNGNKRHGFVAYADSFGTDSNRFKFFTESDGSLVQYDAIHTGNISNYVSNSKVVAGTYTGNGNESMTINLGFTPKAVLLHASDRNTLFDSYYGINPSNTTPNKSTLCLQGEAVIIEANNATYNVVSINDNGFTVYYKYLDGKYITSVCIYANASQIKVNYIAFG